MGLTKVPNSMQDTPFRKNLIINGGFEINQRGTSFAFENSARPSDRWYFLDNTDDTGTFSIEEFTPGQTDVPGNPRNYLRTALTAGSVGSLNDLRQYIENVWYGAGQKVTLSYWIKGSIAFTQTSRRISQEFGSGGSVRIQNNLPNINVTTSWQKITDTFTLGSISGKTIGTSSYLDVILGLPINTTVTVDIAQVQFEIGPEATDFEFRHYGDELALCQRYYWRGGFENGDAGHYSTAGGALMYAAGISFPVTMRSLPSVTIITSPTYEGCGLSDILAGVDDIILRANKDGNNGRFRTYDGVYEADAEL